MLDFNETRTRALLRRRLAAKHLSRHAIQQRIDAYIDVASQLLDRTENLYELLDEDDPRRSGLIEACSNQLAIWADAIVDDGSADKAEAAATHHCPPPPTLARGRRPLLEDYFKLNAYPSAADKKAMADHEGATYRQIHIWFQNRRARAKEQNIPLKKCDNSGDLMVTLLEQDRNAVYAEEMDDFEVVKSESRDDCLPSTAHWAQDPDAAHNQMSTVRQPLEAHLHGIPRHCARRPQTITMDDLVTSFDSMTVRDVGTKFPTDETDTYAAREAITCIPPKAPLPSFVPQELLARVPSLDNTRSLDTPNGRKLAGIPKRRPTARRARTASTSSTSSTSTRSASELSDRAPSLTFSDHSDDSSSPSPTSPTQSDFSYSPPTPSSLDLPSPSLPTVSMPSVSFIPEMYDPCSWREDTGVEGDNEDDFWDHVYRPELNQGVNPFITVQAKARPIKPATKLSRAARRTIRPVPALPPAASLVPPPALAVPPAPSTLVETMSDADADALLAELFGDGAASVGNGTFTLPSWDEIALHDLDVDPAAAGKLDIQLGSWDMPELSHPVPQFSFGPVQTTFGVPVSPFMEREQQHAGTVVPAVAAPSSEGSASSPRVTIEWDAQQIPSMDGSIFGKGFTPNAFDGIIASNWNLEPPAEPTPNPSTLFGKPGLEINATSTSPPSSSDATTPKASSTFSFGTSSTQTPFSFGSSSAAGGETTPKASTFGQASAASRPQAVSTLAPAAAPPAPKTFSFGLTSSQTPFSFATSSAGTSTVTAPMFTHTPTSIATITPSSSKHAPSSSTFAFGRSPSTTFSLSAPSSQTTTAPAPAPFSFGTPASAAANPFNFSATSSAACSSTAPSSFTFGAGSQNNSMFASSA